MTFHAPSIIEKKRDGGTLTAPEISEFVLRFTDGAISDGQMAALAMAIFFRGMDSSETGSLTRAMLASGEQLSWGDPAARPPVVDKHSTGGIGDKVSLVLAPLLACDGKWVPMISGRGLGITGGTLDKLESIPGFRTDLSTDELYAVVRDVGCVITGQTPHLCPADKKLYALRDITGTVPSQALIVASIMSKKLAESLDALVLDVKFGSGAFMKSRKEAESLARAMTDVGGQFGVRTCSQLRPMHEPLGHAVGNALEVVEAIATLKGSGPPDLVATVLDLAEDVTSSSRESLAAYLQNGSAYGRFQKMVAAQGGDATTLESLAVRHRAPFTADLKAECSGVITAFDAGQIGRQAVLLGAGRASTSDSIDFSVGFDCIRKVGDSVRAGDTLLRIHAPSLDALEECAENLRLAVSIDP